MKLYSQAAEPRSGRNPPNQALLLCAAARVNSLFAVRTTFFCWKFIPILQIQEEEEKKKSDISGEKKDKKKENKVQRNGALQSGEG